MRRGDDQSLPPFVRQPWRVAEPKRKRRRPVDRSAAFCVRGSGALATYLSQETVTSNVVVKPPMSVPRRKTLVPRAVFSAVAAFRDRSTSSVVKVSVAGGPGSLLDDITP